MYVCMYVHMYVCMYICMYECKLGKNTSWKPGVTKSMKSWWIDYFSKGNLNWEKHPWKTRNWKIHKKLMIGLLFKRHLCMCICMYVCMYVRMYICMYVCTYICMCVYAIAIQHASAGQQHVVAGQQPSFFYNSQTPENNITKHVHMYVCMYVCMYVYVCM